MAAPVNTPQALIVFNPTITAPTKHMSWPKGSTQEIKWDTENIPAERTATTGVILLGYMENDSENLDIDHPLATGFPLNDGKVTVKMPTDIDSTKDYFVVLFGDSGNKSPVFRIA
ncbi:hypothetical protein HYPSUDRAFT_162093 [Hypholoma sublateritium FD-334 SS-4]|uniref:Yeast cell wall synthesis Kre9/Knh1-like N-terminal domain-containing protein n=1 Tax=Hypholoma sublateritium (strain FD-334 SS-4) TaxID=945553 RepID=A0A0D2PY57_HYPSF|nr:hypothetical protein HYPSUDRAFT_162093 [Hypholoma sublateritium FD-334 SS-4]